MTLLLRDEQQADGRKERRKVRERKKEKERLLALGLLVANDGVEEGREREYGRQTRKEVVEKRGKFGTSADVRSRDVRGHDGFFFSFPFSRGARFSS